jgi:hypothetical protein
MELFDDFGDDFFCPTYSGANNLERKGESENGQRQKEEKGLGGGGEHMSVPVYVYTYMCVRESE